MSIQIRVVGLVASAIIASAASAQTAVEWKVSEGGNGHWYASEVVSKQWLDAKVAAESLGGHLVTITDTTEMAFVFSVSGPYPHWLGGKQIPGSCEPLCGWTWVTGEAWGYSNWNPAEPNNMGNQDTLKMYEDGTWDDTCGCESQRYLIEWESDCNGDGIVDYGQILRGELIDLNSNGVPDICETSISSVIPPSVPSQGGSTITIRGNFPPNPTVKVGGVVATNVNRNSITQITATVPALLPGMASVQVNDFTLPDAIYVRPECGSDLDQNGTVDAGDISIILLDFGPCYEPPAALAAPAPTPLLADEPALKPAHR